MYTISSTYETTSTSVVGMSTALLSASAPRSSNIFPFNFSHPSLFKTASTSLPVVSGIMASRSDLTTSTARLYVVAISTALLAVPYLSPYYGGVSSHKPPKPPWLKAVRSPCTFLTISPDTPAISSTPKPPRPPWPLQMDADGVVTMRSSMPPSPLGPGLLTWPRGLLWG
jgi:hypothetical protein